jgi:hypothetical protein
MLRKLLKRVVLAVVGVLACAAFGGPSVSSAASWGVVGSTHVLDSPNLTFSIGAPINGGWQCQINQLHSVVTSAAVLSVTAATFGGCMGTGNSINCTLTPTTTGFPWTVTGLTTTNIQIHNVHATVLFENTPGNPTACGTPGFMTWTGTLASPGHTHWIGAGHEILFVNATGLVAHTAAGNLPFVINGTLFDTSGTLTLS